MKALPLVILSIATATCGCLPAEAQQVSANPPSPAAVAHTQVIYRWVQKADQCLTRNDLRGAHLAAQKALHLAVPQSDAFADELAPVYLRSEQYTQAAALFGPYPGRNRNLSLNEAIALVKIGRLADAQRCWRESQILTYHQDFKPYLIPSSSARAFEASVFLCRGITDVDQNNPQGGVWALRHALPLAPHNPLLLWYYAEALARTDQPQEARRFYLDAIKQDHGVVFQGARAGLARLDSAGAGPSTL